MARGKDTMSSLRCTTPVVSSASGAPVHLFCHHFCITSPVHPFCHESEKNRCSRSSPGRRRRRPFWVPVRLPLPLSFRCPPPPRDFPFTFPLLLATTSPPEPPRPPAHRGPSPAAPAVHSLPRVPSPASHTFMDLLERSILSTQ
ncbi:hypothetical protein GUJ93_ZPchr0001g31237 [Zizania palustris]|uniref:Uncharacterized protein n=1 Tax=Zizania palustris TaxID=103762 RepID=A0A8J5RZ65_ZIZPA|nr:hypothetical protein GUJ93_ZPchr0001g31237 [Zizania palustris]